MFDIKQIFGVAGVVVGLAGYVPYVRDVFLKKTKPHAFSWLAWAVLEFTAFFAQLSEGAGSGAWITGVSAVIALGIALVALLRRETEIVMLDWVVFSGAILGIILWRLTNNPVFAVILVTASDFLAFIPTYRKSFHHPEQETVFEYICSVIKWIFGLLALKSYSVTTWLYPLSLLLSNAAFVAMTFIRKRQLSKYV